MYSSNLYKQNSIIYKFHCGILKTFHTNYFHNFIKHNLYTYFIIKSIRCNFLLLSSHRQASSISEHIFPFYFYLALELSFLFKQKTM